MIKKAAEYCGMTVALLLIGAAVFTYLCPHCGWQVNAVLSGSMEPSLNTGSLIVTRPVDPDSIEISDIITFNTATVSDGTVTHRVTGIDTGWPLTFQTKGDANEDSDPFTVQERDVVGKVVFNIPLLGYLTQFMKTSIGFFLTVVAPGTILLGFYLWSIRRELATVKSEKSPEAAE